MVWISYVIVVVVFFTPVIGLGRFVQGMEWRVSVPLSLLGTAEIPLTGAPLLFLWCLGAEIIVLLILLLLETSGILTLQRAGLRHKFIYAIQPYGSNNAAVILAEGILLFVAGLSVPLPPIPVPGLMAVILILWMVGWLFLPGLGGRNVVAIQTERILRLAKWILGMILGIVVLSIVAQWLWDEYLLAPLLGAMLNALSFFNLDPAILVLCIFTLMTALAFRGEQEGHYAADLQRNRIRRKQEQREIVIPFVKK